MAKKTRICVVDTVYTLLLYYLICGIDEDDLFIMSKGIPKEIRKNIKHIYYPHFKHSDLPDSNLILIMLKRLQIIIKRAYGTIKLRIILFFKTRNRDVEVYGQGHLNFSFPMYEYENSYIIEDGLGNYMDLPEPNYSQSKLLKFFGFYTNDLNEGFGTHKNVKNVFLTKEYDHPLIKDKVKVINMKNLWENLTKNEKNEILSIFNINSEMFDFEGRTMLILTQPLSQEGYMTLNKELDIYEEIMQKFSDYQTIIKPHPRDDKNYAKIFPNATIIEKSFPIEILTLMGMKPTVVSSIISNSLLNFEESEKYVYKGDLENERLNNLRDELIKLIDN